MNKTVGLCFLAASLSSAAATADDEVLQVWTCTINDGHTVEDLIAVHQEWVEWASDQPGGEDTEGAVLTSIVGPDIDTVLLVDSYSDVAAMSESWSAYMETVGAEMEAAYDKVSTCTGNALWYAHEVEAEDDEDDEDDEDEDED